MTERLQQKAAVAWNLADGRKTITGTVLLVGLLVLHHHVPHWAPEQAWTIAIEAAKLLAYGGAMDKARKWLRR